MACAACGNACNGRMCAKCIQQVANEEAAKARRKQGWAACPECGRDTSGIGVVCFRCRGGGN